MAPKYIVKIECSLHSEALLAWSNLTWIVFEVTKAPLKTLTVENEKSKVSKTFRDILNPIFFTKMQLYIGFAAIVQSFKTWPISTPGKTFWKVFAFNPIKVWPSNPSHKCHLVARISTKYTSFLLPGSIWLALDINRILNILH